MSDLTVSHLQAHLDSSNIYQQYSLVQGSFILLPYTWMTKQKSPATKQHRHSFLGNSVWAHGVQKLTASKRKSQRSPRRGMSSSALHPLAAERTWAAPDAPTPPARGCCMGHAAWVTA